MQFNVWLNNAILYSIINRNKNLALLIIANVLQWKCQCDWKALSSFNEVMCCLCMLLKQLFDRDMSCMCLLIHVKFVWHDCSSLDESFMFSAGRNGSLHLYIKQRLWTCTSNWMSFTRRNTFKKSISWL